MAFRTLDDLPDIAGRRVLVRVDLNVPMADGRVTDTTRIDRILPTLRDLSARNALIGLLAHFGRPKGERVETMSLEPVATALSERLGQPVGFIGECIGAEVARGFEQTSPGGVQLLENTRFHAGEERNDPAFVDALAENGDLYVNDAFSAAHRAHASTEGLAHRLPAYAGRAMQGELDALESALGTPQRPVVALVGGAKVSTKIDLLENLVARVDTLVIGGGMANTFLHAGGVDVGKSLCEADLAPTVKRIEAAASAAGCRLLLPHDVVVAQAFEAQAPNRVTGLDGIGPDDMILDVGPQTGAEIAETFSSAATLVWNGPLGAFEIEPFDRATNAAAQTAAELTGAGKLMSIAGGGDTVAALVHAGVAGEFTYVSTAGGAFLEWLEGKTLPGVAALSESGS
ncbi:MAG: phosphoglycerate kinase [Pseudomonadota bacterium]